MRSSQTSIPLAGAPRFVVTTDGGRVLDVTIVESMPGARCVLGASGAGAAAVVDDLLDAADGLRSGVLHVATLGHAGARLVTLRWERVECLPFSSAPGYSQTERVVLHGVSYEVRCRRLAEEWVRRLAQSI